MRETGRQAIKRIAALALSLALMLSMIPTVVFATDYQTVTFAVTEGETPITGAAVQISTPTDCVVDGYTVQVPAGKSTISYTVSKDGYEDVAAENVPISDGDTIPVNMVSLNAAVTIAKTGSGTVSVNGESSISVLKGSDVAVVITPDDGWYVSACTGLAGWTDEGFNGTIQPTVDTDIHVTFAKYLSVSKSEGDGGAITLDKDTVKTGETVNVTVTPDANHWISSVTGHAGLDFAPANKTGYSKSITITDDTVITASFVEYFTVTASCNEHGSITAPVGGTVSTEKDGTKVTVTATPDAGYRVASVQVNGGTPANFTENDKAYTADFTETTTVQVTFAPNQYQVTIPAETGHGSVSVDKSTVEYDGTAVVTLSPEDGYDIGTVTVNGAPAVWAWTAEDRATVTIGNITADQTVAVTFQTVDTVATPTDITDNENTYAYVDTGATLVPGSFVYAKDTVLVINAKPGYTALRINGGEANAALSATYTIAESMTISVVDVFDGAVWHRLTLAAPVEIVIDKTDAVATLTPDALPTGCTHYNSDVHMTIQASDSDSGLESVEYWVKNGETETQRATLYTHSGAVVKTLSTDTDIKANLNDSDNVTVYVKTTDRAGNVKTEELPLKINTAAPVIDVTLDNNTVSNDKYFNAPRKATITVTDRGSTFSSDRATAAIRIYRADTDAATPTDLVSEGKKAGMISAWTATGTDLHTATITFNEDGYYRWSMDYTNLADSSTVKDDTGTDCLFVIDTVKPTGKIGFETNFWNKLLNTLTFGAWKNYAVTASVEDVKDNSQVEVKYYNSDNAVLSEEGLAALAEGSWSSDPIKVENECRFVAYARLKDMAGNVTYLGSQGVVVDKSDPVITLTPEDANANGYYNSDVKIHVKVEDPGVYSGIKSVNYQVVSDYTAATPNVTQNEAIYTYTPDKPDTIATPSDTADKVASPSDLISLFETDNDTDIVVDATLNNSDYVQVMVTAVDNAGNLATATSLLPINSTVPTVAVKFAAGTAVTTVNEGGTDRGYYNALRTATITIVDRSTTFDAAAATAAVQAAITAVNSENVAVADSYTLTGWTTDGTDTTKHTATITFNKDANFSWDQSAISYTNKAGKTNAGCDVDGTTPVLFTVDTTAPASGQVQMKEVGTGATAWTQTWNMLLTKLTFGIYKRTSIQAEATGEDATSPLVYTYYVTEDVIQKTEDELDQLTFTEGAPTVDPEKAVVVYAKITDLAGNYIYRQTDGAILDTAEAAITLTTPTDILNGTYKGDVRVDIQVNDPAPSSGIKNVSYRVVKDGDAANPTQSGSLYAFTNAAPTFAELQPALDSKASPSDLQHIVVDSALNNSSDVEVFVLVEDNAGNIVEKSIKLDIDITAPTIDISYDNNTPYNGKYFTATPSDLGTRTATVVITERTNHFSEDDATAAINAAITAKDSSDAAVADGYTISAWTTVEGATPDAAAHTATVTFTADANYTFTPIYTDLAGNASGAVSYAAGTAAPEEFTVDNTAPTGSVTADSLATGTDIPAKNKSWDDLRTALTFGFWTPMPITITGTAADATSPIKSISYYEKANEFAATLMSKEDLDALDASDWTTLTVGAAYDVMTVNPDRRAVVYLRIVDMAEHVTYISTDGVISDATAPHEEYTAPTVIIKTDGTTDKIYNADVPVKVTVTDPVVNNIYSGLYSVTYRIINYNVDNSIAKTTTGTLYTFDRESLTADDLCQQLKDLGFTVNAAENNSNKVVIEVTAVDNAGNSTTEKIAVMIDVTAPKIQVEYDNNDGDGEGSRFFKADRTMTITVTERNFDEKLFTPTITGNPTLKWTEVKATSGNGDTTIHKATVTFSADNDYTVEMSCKDIAGNSCANANVDYRGTAPTAFTIDKTVPVVSVNYDNTAARNGNYYNADRTATITIKEHNFDPSRVTITGTANDDGTAVSFPTLSNWSSGSDDNTATLSYTLDALYTFDITVKDKAGNDAADYAAEQFYVDKTKPELRIDGVADRSANNDTVAPQITYSDTNFDENGVTISLRGANNGEVHYNGSYSSITHGQIFSYADFAREKQVDDLYTLNASVIDKAGNESAETIMFSVNRFGSVYDLSGLKDILNKYLQKERDIVFTETNVDSLNRESIRIVLTKNGVPVDLVEGVDYTVQEIGGGGQWSQYRYTIKKELFRDDGKYSIAIYSEDAAGNVNENIDETKDAEIAFGIDKTAPVIIPIDLESNTQYPVESKTVDVEIKDNLVLQDVKIYLNDQEVEYTVNGETYTFEIHEMNRPQNVSIVATDAAGNKFEVDITNFLVSTNVFARYYNNKPLFFGSIGGTAGVAAIALIAVKANGSAAAAAAAAKTAAGVTAADITAQAASGTGTTKAGGKRTKEKE